MSRRLLAAVALIAACASIAATPALASPQSSMLSAINAVRAANGAPPVRPLRALSRSSSQYARYMVAHSRWAHAANPARGAHLRFCGEILGMTTAPDPAGGSVLGGWLGSPIHRPILLNPRFRYIGIGLRHGSMGSQAAWVWVVRFGAR